MEASATAVGVHPSPVPQLFGEMLQNGRADLLKAFGFASRSAETPRSKPRPCSSPKCKGCGGSAPWDSAAWESPLLGFAPFGFQPASREIEAELRAGHEFCMLIPKHPCPFPSIHAHSHASMPMGGMQWGLQYPDTGHIWGRFFGPRHGIGLLMVLGAWTEI